MGREENSRGRLQRAPLLPPRLPSLRTRTVILRANPPANMAAESANWGSSTCDMNFRSSSPPVPAAQRLGQRPAAGEHGVRGGGGAEATRVRALGRALGLRPLAPARQLSRGHANKGAQCLRAALQYRALLRGVQQREQRREEGVEEGGRQALSGGPCNEHPRHVHRALHSAHSIPGRRARQHLHHHGHEMLLQNT